MVVAKTERIKKRYPFHIRKYSHVLVVIILLLLHINIFIVLLHLYYINSSQSFFLVYMGPSPNVLKYNPFLIFLLLSLSFFLQQLHQEKKNPIFFNSWFFDQFFYHFPKWLGFLFISPSLIYYCCSTLGYQKDRDCQNFQHQILPYYSMMILMMHKFTGIRRFKWTIMHQHNPVRARGWDTTSHRVLSEIQEYV